MGRSIDIAIIGAGIAGLWAFNRLSRAGYDVLLLENAAIGAGQTIAAQGIIHSGWKYSLLGHVSGLARSLRAMPGRWRDALRGVGEVDLSAAKLRASSHLMLSKHGIAADIRGVGARFTTKARKLAAAEWPAGLTEAGFDGGIDYMDEPVVDVPSVLRALAEPYRPAIRLIGRDESADPLHWLAAIGIEPRVVLVTAAGSNERIAAAAGHADGLEVQRRPLLQGLLAPAPFPLFAHLFEGSLDKPAVTVTTHETADGTPVWYLGARVAERPKEADPASVYDSARQVFANFLPEFDAAGVRWATVPIDRVEGKAAERTWLPDAPTVHRVGNTLYCWATKMTCAPLFGDMVVAEIESLGIAPSQRRTDFSDLPEVGYAQTPWDRATWTS